MGTFWEQVKANDHAVPGDRPLDELTTELTRMLGDADPSRREGLAYPTLAAWVSAGVYDDLLQGFGDGMAVGLGVGLGESGTDTVFRRSFSSRVLAECLLRDIDQHLLVGDAVLRWGDRIASWFVRERDLRGFVPGKGWANTLAHGADAIGALAGSRAMGRPELTVLLDVVSDRLVAPTEHRLVQGEADRMSLATMTILRRDLIDVDVLEPWMARLVEQAPQTESVGTDPSSSNDNVESYLRSLHLQLALTPNPPRCRSDLLLVVIEALRKANPNVLGS